LTAANAELESFSNSVAHHLRAPLRQVAGLAKQLGVACGPDLGDDSIRYLHRIQQGSQHMGTLIDDLLSLAKISRHKMSRRPACLSDILAAVLEELKPEWEGRAIEWQIDPLWTCNCDPNLITQVFVNLLSNAIKFTRRRPLARIHVGQTTVEGEQTLFVRDNGAGFDMAYAVKLFGVFQRFHKAEDFEGTGIGLANVQRIVAKHGGRIWAEAEVDKGACFFLTLPDAHS
jgi:light-regulated signal transduction histidine kinase (bacteriophytochrome)